MTTENDFKPELPKQKVDMIYLCFPNNPTGTVLTREELKKWIDYARENKSIILYDAAYEAFISEENVPHSIYEVEGAKDVAIEFKSFSKKQLKVLSWWCAKKYIGYDAIICDGAVRSGKTLCMFLSFVFWAISCFDGGSFAVCGKTVTSLKRNIVTPMVPILEELGFRCKLVSSKGQLQVSYKNKSIILWLFGSASV